MSDYDVCGAVGHAWNYFPARRILFWRTRDHFRCYHCGARRPA